MNLKVKTKLHKINVIQSFIYSFFFYFSSPYRMNCIQHLSWKKKKNARFRKGKYKPSLSSSPNKIYI